VSDEWTSWLSDQAIRRTVGAETYRRGAAYFREGRVSRLKVNADPRTLFATVSGNRRVGYQTLVTAGRGTGESVTWSGRCTCPMVINCKHVAAVLLAGRESTAGSGFAGHDAGPSWERTISDVVRTSAAGRDDTGAPLALQLEIVTPAQPRASAYRSVATLPAVTRIRLRPVIRGRSGAWVRTGVSWRDLQHSYGSEVPAHREVLRELYAAYQVRANSYDNNYYSYGEQAVHLDDLGTSVWRLLERALEAGVALVPAKASAGPIVLAPELARVRLDLRRDEEGGAATLAGVVEVAGRTVVAAAVSFLGNPIHGLFIQGDGGFPPGDLPPGDSSHGDSPAGGAPGLLLARLDRQPSESASGLLREGQPLVIPAGDLGRFLSGYYPALRQAIDVVSSDASVPLPEIAPPRLALTVTYRPDQQTGLHWAFAYAVGDSIERLPLRGPTGAVGMRDVLAERHLLGRLELPDSRLPQLRTMVADQHLLAPDVALGGIDAAYFTEDLLPSLRENDDVLVEVEGTAPDYRYTDAAPLVQLSATETADDRDWFNLGVRVFIDGEEIPFQPLFVALARGDSHLVLDSGTWFSIERPELEQLRHLIEEARSLQDRESDGLRLSPYQAGLWEELTSLGVVETQSARWAKTVKGLLEIDDLPAPPVPHTIVADLRPYQVDGYQWLSFLRNHGLGGILADDMGLGKTVQTLAMICGAHEPGTQTRALNGPFLVVAPTSVVPNWSHEGARFAPHLKVAMVTETEAKRAGTLAERINDADVVVTSYALFRIDYEAYAALQWSGLILDEAQFVKNHQSKTYQCARRLPAPFKMALTGTPLENSLMDLWSLLSIVAPGLFPSPERFSEHYRKPIEAGGAPELLAALRRRIRPLMRRRTKEQVATELPPKQEQVLEVALNPRHQKIYQTHLQRERQKVLGLIDDLDKNRFTIFRSLTLLRQLSLDPALVDPSYAGVRSSKADAFLEQLEEVVSGGHRALVFSQFTGFLTTIRDRLDAEGISYCYLDGRTRDRARCIKEFKNGDAPVFLISLKAGGFGLNLTEADYCFVLDPWWNPAAEAQAVDRAHRIGQDKTVMVYRLVATGTIEEKVMALKARKSDLFARVMDEDALLSTPLSANDIRSLLA
jgi:hypothetical protein